MSYNVKVLLAVDKADAEHYIGIYPELADAKVRYVAPRRLEGLRVSEAYATARARYHADYPDALRTLLNSFLLGKNGPPRIL